MKTLENLKCKAIVLTVPESAFDFGVLHDIVYYTHIVQNAPITTYDGDLTLPSGKWYALGRANELTVPQIFNNLLPIQKCD